MKIPQPSSSTARGPPGRCIETGPDPRILDHVAAAVYTCDDTGRITYFNDAAAELWGRRPELHHERWCGSWRIHELDGTPVSLDQCPMALTLKEGRAVRAHEVVVERPDGVRRRVMQFPEPLHDDAGHLIGAISVVMDVTEMSVAAERAEVALSEAEAHRDEFVATLAHELRNPLTPLGIAAQMLHNTPFRDATSSGVVLTLKRQVDTLTRLVDDLLESARITRGRIVLRKADAELKAIIDNAVETARPHLDQARHELRINLPAQPVRLHVDATRLAQIVGSLLNNAAKFTPDGGRIALAARAEAGRLVLTVSDNGMGIPSEQLPYVFDLYAQSGQGRRHVQGGMGIGLFVAKKLAELHGGTLRAASPGEGLGTELTLVLPCEPRPVGPAADPGRGGHRAENGLETSLRILVADDNHGAADIMAIAMRSMGADVRVVYDGKAAVEAVGSFRPALVFMDIGMIGVDGHEAARQIRAEPANEGIVLIAVSGWGQDEVLQRSREAGFDHHVVKPIGLEELRQIVRDNTR